VFTIPLLLLIVFYPNVLLSFFGNDYKDGSSYIIVISLCHLATILLGPSGTILAMTDNESSYRNSVILSAILSTIISMLFPIFWGLNGAIAAICVSMLSQSAILMIVTGYRLGFISTAIGVFKSGNNQLA
jgi:O-antigen/teichoic acid export membrane protein